MQENTLSTNGTSAPRREIAQSFYDERMFRDLSQSLYEGSGFYNWGYWMEDTRSRPRNLRKPDGEVARLVS